MLHRTYNHDIRHEKFGSFLVWYKNLSIFAQAGFRVWQVMMGIQHFSIVGRGSHFGVADDVI